MFWIIRKIQLSYAVEESLNCCWQVKPNHLNKFHFPDHSMIMSKHNQHYQITRFYVTADKQNVK